MYQSTVFPSHPLSTTSQLANSTKKLAQGSDAVEAWRQLIQADPIVKQKMISSLEISKYKE